MKQILPVGLVLLGGAMHGGIYRLHQVWIITLLKKSGRAKVLPDGMIQAMLNIMGK
jgi:hypothetical protein